MYATKPRGFIALISSIIISVILLSLAVTVGATTFYSRIDTLHAEYKRMSLGLAEACVNQALLKIGQNYNYLVTADPTYNIARGGAVVPVGAGDCVIKSPTTLPAEVNGKRNFTISVQGVYKGAYSNLAVAALVKNPTVAPLTPPPTCSLLVSPTSVQSGNAAVLAWSASANATSMQIDHGIGVVTPTLSGTVGITPSGIGSITYTATASNAGGNGTCTATVTVLPPPPAPSCADTVMVLDRSGSIFSSNADDDEAAAGRALIDVYATVSPAPKVGVGSAGGIDGSLASVPVSGQLSSAFASLKSLVTTIMSSQSSVGSPIANQITVGADELNSGRHTSGKQKVLVVVTDGDANEPTAASGDTGFLSPTANAQDASLELWLNPAGAYADAGSDASDAVLEDDQHRYYNFNFPTIPSGATINGIEAVIDAWTTGATVQTPASSARSPLTAVSPNQWTSPLNVTASDNNYTTNAVIGQQQAFGTFSFAIPANATITGIAVTTEAKVTSATPIATATLTPNGQGSDSSWSSGNESDIDETGTPDCSSNDRIDSNNNGNRESVNIDLSSIPNGSTVTSVQVLTWDQSSSGGNGVYQTYARVDGTAINASGNLNTTSTSGCTARTQTIDLPDFAKSGSTDFEVGVMKVGNNPEARVGTIRAIVNYLPTAGGSLSVSLSSNNGGSWTPAKSATLGSEAVVTPTGNSATDLWGRTWVPADFNNGNFALRVQNGSATGNTTALDQTVVTVSYTVSLAGAIACDLRMDLSWNGGSTWTSEKSQTLNGTETTYTLGSVSDDWSGHTWAAGDFTNSNFRARVHAADPGATCDSTTIDHLDWLRMRVSYTQSINPLTAATNAANAAKAGGGADGLPISIFGIHFGDTTHLPDLKSWTTQNVVSVPITSFARSSNVVTVTTPAVHNLTKGQQVTVTGASSGSYNGTFIITSIPTANTFRYSQSASNGNATGGSASVNKNFFVAPTSADMQGIFQAIGVAVCPAAAAQCANQIDDDSDGFTDDVDPDCHSDGNAANPGTYVSTDNDEWGPLVVPTPPPPPPPPPTIEVGSWVETP